MKKLYGDIFLYIYIVEEEKGETWVFEFRFCDFYFFL